MNPERIIAGLDIGSAKTTVVIAEAVGDKKRTPSLRILGVGQARTTGLRRGIVSDIEETTRSIKKAVEDGSSFDTWTSSLIIVGYAIPGFLFAILLIILFAGGSFFDIFPLRGLFSENWAQLNWFQKIADR